MNLDLHNITFDYAGTPIIAGASGSIAANSRIGVIGANGCGKSTLLGILNGSLESTGGSISRSGDLRLATVPQQLLAPVEQTVVEYLLADVYAAGAELRSREETLSTIDPADEGSMERALSAYAAARERYDELNGDFVAERCERLLGQLGLTVTLEQPLQTLSGGERNVLMLAKAVLGEPNLLLLDEPGNHLDFDGLAWLESYLESFPGAIVVVSHNRYLLDRIVEETWHLSNGTITRYAGGYSDYRFSSLRDQLSAQAEHAAQQKTLARMRELVRTFEERARVTADPKWGKRLRARRTQLEKLEEQAIDKPELDAHRLRIEFHREAAKSDIAVEVRAYSRTIGGRQLFDNAEFLVHTGERVGIVGPNGCGKTTFLRDLVTEGSWEHASLRITPSQMVGYCAQHRDRFRGSTAILDATLSAGDFTRHAVFGVLSRLRFQWEDLDRTVETLSGGEWNRLQIGIAILGRANLLILDEPTNHLDIPSREAVEEALEEFAGTVITVSHDRYFLSAVASRIIEVRDRQFIEREESVTEFLSRCGRSRLGTPARRSDAVDRAAERSRTIRAKPSRNSQVVEAQIVELESERSELEAAMARAFEQRDYRTGRRLGTELAKVAARIEELYESWGEENSP